MSDSSISARTKENGYDPTTVLLPPDAVRAGPGERQIAYPPQFPRAKINGTPDGLTSVHIGVRPRAPGGPTEGDKRTALNGPAFPETGETRNAGKGKLNAESRMGSGSVDLGKRREGYGEVHSDMKDGSSTTGSDHSGFSRRDDHQQEASRHAAPIRRLGEKQESSRQPQRAVPRMTLQEAVEQWDKNHPSDSSSLSHRNGIGGIEAADTGMPEESSDLGDDGRSHDGIYTYDYSGSFRDSVRSRSKASSSKTRLDEAASARTDHIPRTVVHVDGTEGPVRIYPRPPEHENSYGVPFGKRLKALIQMRKAAEENGLVASSVEEDGILVNKGRAGAYDSVRRPAVTSRENALHPKVHSSPGRPSRPSTGQTTGGYAREPEALESDFSDTTPTRRQTRAAAPSPQTPSEPISHRLPRPSSAHTESRSSSAGQRAKSTILAQESVATKLKRKPVPRYIGDTTLSSGQTSEDIMRIRKHKSESSFKRDPSEAEKHRKSHQRGSKSPKKSHTPRPATGFDTDPLRRGEVFGESGHSTHLKGLAVARSPTSVPSGRHSAGPRDQQSKILDSPARISAVAPPMPDGEEYDSETEAERQAAWEEYYRVMRTSGAVPLGDATGGHMVDNYQDSYGTGGYLDDPAFPYVGGMPDYPGMSPNMPGMRPPMGGMYPGMPNGGMGMYGPHPGMMPNMGQGFMAPGVQPAEMAGSKQPGRPAAPASRPKAISSHSSPQYPDVRKDVRFAGSAGSPSKMISRPPGYASFRYPSGQAGYMSHEHTPASSAVSSPAVDAPNPMDLYSPQYGHYGYSPYAYPSYPNTPSVFGAAGYSAQTDPFTFEEMSEAIEQPKQSSGASLQDRRKKSWYGPHQ